MEAEKITMSINETPVDINLDVFDVTHVAEPKRYLVSDFKEDELEFVANQIHEMFMGIIKMKYPKAWLDELLAFKVGQISVSEDDSICFRHILTFGWNTIISEIGKYRNSKESK